MFISVFTSFQGSEVTKTHLVPEGYEFVSASWATNGSGDCFFSATFSGGKTKKIELNLGLGPVDSIKFTIGQGTPPEPIIVPQQWYVSQRWPGY